MTQEPEANPDDDAEEEVEMGMEDGEDLEIEGLPCGDPTISQRQHHSCSGGEVPKA
jgi:hypothetical protein